MSIDTGLGLTYKENYPLPGINQTSQQFRDNFTVLREALENLHAAKHLGTSLFSVRLVVSPDDGSVTFDLDFPDFSTGRPATAGTMRIQDGALEYWTGSNWATVSAVGTPTTDRALRSVVNAMLAANTSTTGITVVPGANSTLVFQPQTFTIDMVGDVTGNATIANLANATLNARLDPVAFTARMADSLAVSGLTAVATSNAVTLTANSFSVALTGAVSGNATVSALSDTTISTTIDLETIQDIVGAMVIGSTQRNVRVTYDDNSGKLNFESTGDAAGRNALSTAVASTVVLRDANASFVANTITAASFVGDVFTSKKLIAERFHADATYDAGTVLVYGGAFDVTTTSTLNDARLAGVVVGNVGFALDATYGGQDPAYPYLALVGRATCKVIGAVAKGDILTTSTTPGYAIVATQPTTGAIIGKSLDVKTDAGLGTVTISVQRS
jgi:hypothetical protein